MIDLSIDITGSSKNDLTINNYDLVLVTDADRLRRKLLIRLQFFYGEWYLDTTQGVKLYDEVLIANPSLARIEAILKAVISETDGVESLTMFNAVLDHGNRRLSVSFTVQSKFGTISLETTL